MAGGVSCPFAMEGYGDFNQVIQFLLPGHQQQTKSNGYVYGLHHPLPPAQPHRDSNQPRAGVHGPHGTERGATNRCHRSRHFLRPARSAADLRNLLLGLRNTVESRFYRPDLWRLLDPVITSGNQLLRLECFSSCASVYARADFTQNAFTDGAFHRNGTTNVDFNGAFLNHLANCGPASRPISRWASSPSSSSRHRAKRSTQG